MPAGSHTRRPWTALAVATAVLVPLLGVVPAAGALPAGTHVAAAAVPASAASDVPTTATASVPAADVTQPTVREVSLAGVDPAVLAKAPEPDHTLSASSTTSATARLRPAVAAQVRATNPAVLVAVAADRPFADGSSIQLRVREKSPGSTTATWSDWTELETDPSHGPDPDSAEAQHARVGSSPLMTSGARKVQIRIDTPTGRVPKGTQLTLVAAPTAASDASIGSAVSSSAVTSGGVSSMATVGQPTIVTRAQWGADESWRSREPYYTSDIRVGFIHHTASTSNYTAAQAAAQIRAIYAYHTKSLGHSDIDYNFVVDRFGRLYEGRYGGITKAVLGGHTAGFNEHSFAVVALGNFSTFKPAATQMAAMKDAIARLFAWKLGLSGVNPAATVSLVSAGYIKATKYPKGSIATISATSSHQTVNYTACPGTYLQAQLSSIRALAASYSKVVISAPSPPATVVQAGSVSSVTLTSSADRAVSWTADIFSPCSDTPVRTLSGSTTGAGTVTLKWNLKDSAGEAVLPATYTVALSGTAQDGTSVAAVSSTITITPKPGGSWGPCANASRVVGDTPAQTSVLWGRIAAPDATTVVLTGSGARGSKAMATALAAAPLARVLGAPLLQTSAASLDSDVAADISARRATSVLVVGDTSIVSDTAAQAAGALGATVIRIAGTTAASTAWKVSALMAEKSATAASAAVLVSPDGSPATAISGAALAAARGVPLLLGVDSTIPKRTRQALATRTSVTVASAVMSDAIVSDVLAPGTTWSRVTGSDAVSASLAVAGAFPGKPKSVVLVPENSAAWLSVPAGAAAGTPLLISTSPTLSESTADYLSAHSALRATVTPVSSSYVDDQVLGATSRVLRGEAWSPPGVALTTSPKATSTRTLTRTNAKPEPVTKGTRLTITTRVRAKFTDGVWRKVPAGVPFTLQFKPKGTSAYKTVKTGTTITGRATLTRKAKKSGRWRIVVGTQVTASDYVRVR